MEGPGPMRCVMSKDFLETLPASALKAFLREKGLPTNYKTRKSLLQAVFRQLEQRQELVSTPQQLPWYEKLGPTSY